MGIVENAFGNTLAVFPNPTNGNFYIDMGRVYENTSVSITDVFGKVLQETAFNTAQLLNLSFDKPSGVYFIIILSDGKKAVIRLIKT